MICHWVLVMAALLVGVVMLSHLLIGNWVAYVLACALLGLVFGDLTRHLHDEGSKR